jgi:hypothetical protein
MAPREAIDETVANLDKRQSVHEAECALRYRQIVSGLEEMKMIVTKQGDALARFAAKMTERAGSGRAAREIVAYGIALAGILSALYSGGLVHSGH